MARPRKNSSAGISAGSMVTPGMAAWAEALGEALGRGVARGINSGLATNGASATNGERRRGRPPKAKSGALSPDRICKVPDCGREARSKGLCSAHYQAERRRMLAKG